MLAIWHGFDAPENTPSYLKFTAIYFRFAATSGAGTSGVSRKTRVVTVAPVQFTNTS
jgi:hypothetical protein